jgi:hypothetical protein
MRHRLLRIVAAVLVSTAVMSGTARGDSILIRGGSIGFDTGDPPAFTAFGDDFAVWALFPRIATSGAFTCAPVPCPAGSLVNIGTVFGGETRDFVLGYGTATIGGTTYGSLQDGLIQFRGTLTFDAPTFAVPSTQEQVRFVGPSCSAA